MGFILDAIGAASGAGADIMADQRKSDLAVEQQRQIGADTEARQRRLAEYNAQLEEKRQRMIQELKLANIPLEEKAKADAEDSTRLRRAGELEGAQKGLIEKAIAAKANKFYNDGRTREYGDLAPEEIASPELQLTAREKSEVLQQAGVKTGMLGIKDALATDTREANIDAQSEYKKALLDFKYAENDAKAQAAMARIEALAARTSAGREDIAGARLGHTALLNQAGQNLREARERLSKIPPGAMNDKERQAAQRQVDMYEAKQEAAEKALLESLAMKPDSGGSKTPAAAPASGPKKGDTRTVAAGPNKGKTAVFDGKGWVLQ